MMLEDRRLLSTFTVTNTSGSPSTPGSLPYEVAQAAADNHANTINFGPLFNKASSDEAKNTAKTNINKRLTYINDQLANHQYLLGSNFTVADAYAFTIINWTNFVGIDLKAYPNIAAYQARVGGRPKVYETLKAEGLAK